jgi:hypothetical protein
VKSFGAKMVMDFRAFKEQIFGVENIFYNSGNKFEKSVSNKIVRGKRG